MAPPRKRDLQPLSSPSNTYYDYTLMGGEAIIGYHKPNEGEENLNYFMNNEGSLGTIGFFHKVQQGSLSGQVIGVTAAHTLKDMCSLFVWQGERAFLPKGDEFDCVFVWRRISAEIVAIDHALNIAAIQVKEYHSPENSIDFCIIHELNT